MPAKGQLSGYHIKCEFCGKEIYQTKTQYNKAKHHFCSNKCQKDFQHRELFEDRECEICKKKFHVSKKSTQRFCSTECQGKWQSTQIGEKNPRRKRIKCKCSYCNKELSIIPSNYNRFKEHFCNNECREKWYAEIYSQTEERKNESRENAISYLQTTPVITNTKPQRIINELLNNLNILYENEKSYIYYSADNYLINNNLIIEVMGDFWHCNPLKYNSYKKYEMQQKRVEKDKMKHDYIKRTEQIEILYLWEKDIYENLDLCKQLILKYINSNGNLFNYHSFNYSFINNELVLNDNIIIPYQEQIA